MRKVMLGAVLLLLLAAACTPAQAPTAVPPTQPAAPPPAATVIVTLAREPQPTATPAITFDVTPYTGTWSVNARFQFDGGPVMEQIRFLGGATVRVADDATVLGEGVLVTGVSHPGCLASIQDDGEIPVTVTGSLRQGANGVEMVVTFTPEDPDRIEHYRLECNTFTEPLVFEQQTLWPALAALNVQPYVLPAQPGANLRTTDDLAAATGQTMQGTLTTTIGLRR